MPLRQLSRSLPGTDFDCAAPINSHVAVARLLSVRRELYHICAPHRPIYEQYNRYKRGVYAKSLVIMLYHAVQSHHAV